MQTPFVERKILHHLPILTDYLGGGMDYAPIMVQIDLTNLCASNCPWCAGFLNRKASKAILMAGEGDHRYETSLYNVQTLLRELQTLGVKAITWTGGGDPTQHRHVEEIVAYAHKLGFEQGFITHGVTPTTTLLPFLTWIRYSVDAGTEEGYEKQHGRKDHFKQVLANIENALEYRDDNNLNVTIGVGFLTHKDTWHEMRTFAHYWHNTRIDYIQFRPLHDTHGESWFSDNASVLSILEELAEDYPKVTWSRPKYKMFGKPPHGRTEFCHGVYFETAIAADSNVYVCCHLKGNPKYSLGNLMEESFEAIWKRFLQNRSINGFTVTSDCPSYCHHFGTNHFIEHELLVEPQHVNFI